MNNKPYLKQIKLLAEIANAAADVVGFVKHKYNIKDDSGFTCPHLLRLSKALDALTIHYGASNQTEHRKFKDTPNQPDKTTKKAISKFITLIQNGGEDIENMIANKALKSAFHYILQEEQRKNKQHSMEPK